MRIRTTKPEYWRSQDTAKLTYFARLLFVGLWNYCDDNGVGEDDEHLIRSDLFPRDDVLDVSPRIRGGLTELSHLGQIVRYSDSRDARRYLAITNWHHQRIEKPSQARKPHYTSEHATFPEGSPTIPGVLLEGSGLYQGTGTREQGSVAGARPSPFCKRHPAGTTDDCGGCGRARLMAESWEENQLVAEGERLRAAVKRRVDCLLCDDHGLVEIGDGVARCTHEMAPR